MTRIIHGAGVGVTHGAGDGLSEFPSDLADAGTAGSAAALSVQASDASALVTLASSIRGSDASALRMRVLVAVSAAAVADSIIKPAAFRSDRQVKKSRAAFRKIGRLGIAHRQNGQPGDGSCRRSTVELDPENETGGQGGALPLESADSAGAGHEADTEET